MENWNLFQDPRFALRFEFPGRSSSGELVNRVETQRDGMLRVHIFSPQSREVYVEVSKYDSLSAESEYRRHKDILSQQFRPLKITELKAVYCGSLPAYEYAFEWDQGSRVVILVEREDGTYRIIYDPRHSVNLQILSTLQWLNL